MLQRHVIIIIIILIITGQQRIAGLAGREGCYRLPPTPAIQTNVDMSCVEMMRRLPSQHGFKVRFPISLGTGAPKLLHIEILKCHQWQ